MALSVFVISWAYPNDTGHSDPESACTDYIEHEAKVEVEQGYQDIPDYKLNPLMLKFIDSLSNLKYNENYKNDRSRLEEEISTLKTHKERLVNFSKNVPKEHMQKIYAIILPEIDKIDVLLNKYYEDMSYVELWEKRFNEYPAATEVWLIMKEWGWNDAVCAGVIGNMMAEVGGQTLNLKACIYGGGNTYYGLCMWSLKYYPEAADRDIPQQMEMLYNSIKKQFDYAGFCYRSGFTLDDFFEMTDPGEAAIAFAKVYERPASQYVAHRAGNAWVAYNYFCGE